MKIRMHQLRWVAPERIHLTLRFLGEVEDSRRARLQAALSATLSGFEGGISLSLSGIGVFPERGSPRVLWAELGDDQASPGGIDRLRELHLRVEQGVVAGGCEPGTRTFRPHLTLARFPAEGSRPGLPETIRGDRLEPVSFQVDRVCLMHSFLEPGGARYEILQEYRF